MTALEQLAVDGDGLLALAHDGIDHGHVALVMLVARIPSHGFLQERHDFQAAGQHLVV